ncbi:MAG TPA: hypothetical protein VGJ18_00110 [Gemmatimonadaceae bacterium]|jgi:hypothetical protein
MLKPLNPALTSEEWRLFFKEIPGALDRGIELHPREGPPIEIIGRPGYMEIDGAIVTDVEAHRLVALCNASLSNADACKITRELVDALELVASNLADPHIGHRSALQQLARALRALLPPADIGH